MATINGTGLSEVLVGTSLADEIFGRGGNDTLRGRGGDDDLRGGNGADRLIGVDVLSATPGLGEIDTIRGNGGADTFVLGDGVNVFYSFNDSDDFADIRGFQSDLDIIELTGDISDYFFNPDNTAIFETSSNDLIAEFTNGAFAFGDLTFVSL